MAKIYKLLIILCVLFAGVSILLLSDSLQQITLKPLLLFLLGIFGLVLYFVFNEIKVISYLYLSPVIFFRQSIELNITYTIGLVCVFIFQYLNDPENTKTQIPYAIFFVLLLVAGIRSIIIGIHGWHPYTFFFNECILPILIIITVVNSPIKKDEIRQLIFIHVVFASLLSIIGVTLAITHPGERMGSTWEEAMTINGYYILAFFLGIGLMDEASRGHQKILFVLTISILLGMIFTYTRVVLVGVVIGLFIMSLKKPQFLKYFLILLITAPLLIPGDMIERVQNLQTADTSILIRLLVWYYSVKLIILKPLWGYGFDSFVILYKSLISIKYLRAIHSHNVYLRLLVEIGFIGFIGYMGVVFDILLKGYKHTKSIKGLTLTFLMWVALIVELVFCITDVFISQVSISFIFWLLLALLYKVTNEMKTNNLEQIIEYN